MILLRVREERGLPFTEHKFSDDCWQSASVNFEVLKKELEVDMIFFHGDESVRLDRSEMMRETHEAAAGGILDKLTRGEIE